MLVCSWRVSVLSYVGRRWCKWSKSFIHIIPPEQDWYSVWNQSSHRAKGWVPRLNWTMQKRPILSSYCPDRTRPPSLGGVYTTTLLGENEEISLRFSLPFTPKRWKRQAKRRLLKTGTKVETLKTETSKTSVFLV